MIGQMMEILGQELEGRSTEHLAVGSEHQNPSSICNIVKYQ